MNEKRESTVLRQVDMLDRNVGRILELLEQLEERLISVLVVAETKDVTQEMEKMQSVPLANDLRKIAIIAENCVYKLDDFLNRIDI